MLYVIAVSDIYYNTPIYYNSSLHVLGQGVAQLVEAMRYKPEGRAFDSLWGHWDFLLTQALRQHYNPVVDSATKTDAYQGYLLGVKSSIFT
jgi:hypothetical protein